jgi:endonuclease/exonuclease/phosphatase (EEP) superfamily protein YafD
MTLIGKHFLRICNIFAKIAASLTGVFVLFIMIMSSLEHMGLIGSDSVFLGISYLPPAWLFPAVIILAALLLFLHKRKYAAVAAAAYFFYFLLWGDYSFQPLLKKEEPLRGQKLLSVLSLNVRYYSDGAEKVLHFIDSLDNDINLVSENTLDADSIKKIIGPGNKYYVVAGKKYETGILSKYPVISYSEIEFPSRQASLSGSNIIDSLKNNPRRSFSHITIKYENEIVNVISVRFIAGRPQSKKLKDQVVWGNYVAKQHLTEAAFFVDYVKKLKGPVVFGGDLNAPPNAKVMDGLYKIADDAAFHSHFIPAPTFRTEFPVMRLDYIFTMNGFKTFSYTKINTIVSDHFAVSAKMFIKSK